MPTLQTKGKNPGEKLSVIFEPKNNAVVVSAYDEVINISEEKKAGRVLYDKKKELSKTTIASKARTIDNSKNSITNNKTDFNSSVNKHEEKTDTEAFKNWFGNSCRVQFFAPIFYVILFTFHFFYIVLIFKITPIFFV